MANAQPASGAAGRLNGRVFFGVGLALLGIALLTDRRDPPGLYLPAGWWPVFVILFGLSRLVDPGDRDGQPRSRRGGAWLLGVGIWGLVSETRLLGFGYATSWPLLVVLVGISVVWRALEHPASCRVR